VEQENGHQVVLGEPGAGKTLALRTYLYELSQQPGSIFYRNSASRLYTIKHYSLYVKKFVFGDTNDLEGEEGYCLLVFSII